MPRRIQIRAITHNFLRHFVSRNNDYEGYWALGIIYALAEKANVMSVEITLVPRHENSHPIIFDKMLTQYRFKLTELFQKQGLPDLWLNQAKIYINFKEPENGISSFECSLKIVNDLGSEYIQSTKGFCRKHDSQVESRRHNPFCNWQDFTI